MFLVLLSICAIAQGYTDIEPVDVDALLKNPQETRMYMDCLIDKGPCTPVMAHIKSHLLEAVKNACQNCSPQEKHEAEEFFFNIFLQYPEYMIELRNKYDPEGKNFKKFVFELSRFR